MGRILYVNNFPGPGMGGGEILLLHLVRGAIAAGWEVSVLCPPEAELAERAQAAGATVRTTSMRPGHVRAIISEIRRFGSAADIIAGTGYFTNILVRLAAGGLGAKVLNLVQTELSASLADGGSRGGMAVRSAADTTTRFRVDAYIAVSRFVGEALVTDGVRPDRVHIVRNGVDIPALRAAAAEPLPPGLPAGTGPLVGCVARLEPVKGVSDFVAAATLLARERPDARFAIAGSGSEEAALRGAVPPDLDGRLAFLGDVRPSAPLIARLELLALPSRSEGLPTVLLEAGALGVPVVATAVGGVPEVVDDGATGLLVPAGEPVAMAGAMTELLGNPVRATALGAAAARRIEREFSVEHMIDGHLEVYARMVGR